ncbi:MAG: nicotinate phosphoribosyltransferase [Candidatus Omnitrophica bacterium]|nr:nicotinate phosphoribosyltransferase [Candidatus Omnitrophota bacterium]
MLRNSDLVIDLYELTMAQVYFKHRQNAQATFDLFIRAQNRPFYVACGIDDAINSLENFKFNKNEMNYLRSLGMFDEEFLKYLANFRFEGTVWALREPEIVFAYEPILRVTGDLIEAQIVESLLLNQINLATTLATKAARVVFSAEGKGVYDFALRRTQGVDASLACAKYSYMVGAQGTSNILAGSLYKIPVVGTMAHSFVMSFDREIESFLNFAKEFPAKTILLVDTYDVKKGVESAIKVAIFLAKRGVNLVGIRLDSGDLILDACYARHLLDKKGFIDTIIFASGSLDEYKIKGLIKAKAPIDAFGIGTNMGCSSDLPYTDVIYKLVEIKGKGKSFIPAMKLSKDKVTYPGRKQVFRKFDANGKMSQDWLGLNKETMPGKRMLKKIMVKGKRICKEKTLKEKRESFLGKSFSLPDYLKDLSPQRTYSVKITKSLYSLTNSLIDQIKQRIKKKVIFLDIDTQVDFLDKKGALYIPGAEKIIVNLNKLTEFASKQKILILSSQDIHRKDDPEFKEFPPHCIKGTVGCRKIKGTLWGKNKRISSDKACSFEEIKRIKSKYPQIILEKNILNLFSNPNLLNFLEAISPDKIVVYGVATEHCIREAVEGLVKESFEIILVEDAIKEISKKEKDKLFIFWKKKGVEFIKTEKVFSLLESF